MRKGHEQEIDLSNLLKHLLQSGTEKKQESDEDSYLAAVLLLRVRSSQFDMSLSVERSAGAKVQDVSMGPTPTRAATRLQALHRFLHIRAALQGAKAKASSPTVHLSILRAKAKARERDRREQRQRQRKRKELQITQTQYTSCPSTASHYCAWQRLRHTGARLPSPLMCQIIIQY